MKEKSEKTQFNTRIARETKRATAVAAAQSSVSIENLTDAALRALLGQQTEESRKVEQQVKAAIRGLGLSFLNADAAPVSIAA